MNKFRYICLLLLAIVITGCSNHNSNSTVQQVSNDQEQKILISYFTRLDNTKTENIDEIISGDGPYGKINEDDTDALSSASIQVNDNEYLGNTEWIAKMIESKTGGTLFSIKTVDKYPVDYDALIDQGNQENNDDARPKLANHVDNIEDYDVIFIGFPDWYYDMPMAVCSFIEEYDFSNKTIIPFCTSAGSGFANSINTLNSLLNDDTTVLPGLEVNMKEVDTAQDEVDQWLEDIDFK